MFVLSGEMRCHVRRPVQPTEVELAILQVLWERGCCSLGQIHEAISQTRETAYSSTRKMVQVMRDKELLSVDDSVRPNLYDAVMSREQTQSQMLEDLAHKAFGGSAKKVSHEFAIQRTSFAPGVD